MRIAFVQFGDYKEAWERFRDGGEETYYAQRYSVDYVEALTEKFDFVGVCAMLGDQPYEEALTDRLTSACVPKRPNGALDEAAIIALLEKWRINYLVLQTPASRVLKWAIDQGVRTLPLFADSWEEKGLRERYRAFRLSKLLNHQRIPMVGNHNIPASLSLKKIGVKPSKVFPWDWPHEHTPDKYPVKTVPDGKKSILYVGQMIEDKGVGECLDAASALKRDGIDFKWTFIGAGSFEKTARARVEEAGLTDTVEILGRRPHSAVLQATKDAAVSVVPSRHIYPEGLPMTIYEGLATRTPLVLSDHPMFKMFFMNTPAVKMIPERAPEQLANAIKKLLTDKAAYAEATQATGDLWRGIVCETTWGMLIDRWIDSPRRPAQSIMRYSLEARLAR